MVGGVLLRPGPVQRVSPSASTASTIASLAVTEFDRDAQRVAVPIASPHLVVRLGVSTGRGLDAHVMGARDRAHRKLIRGGQRAVFARFHLGAHEAVLGASPQALAGRAVPLDALWGDEAAERLLQRVSEARTLVDAAAVVDDAIAARLARARAEGPSVRLARAAAARLDSANVGEVARGLGVSERNLRRVFREVVGIGPKAYARLARFHRALRAAHDEARGDWASIAVASGYYDQAHLIAEFREIAGVTPRALLRELAQA